MLLYQIKNKQIESSIYRQKTFNYLFMSIIYEVFMMDAFTTYESFLNKNTASFGVICITLIEVPLKVDNVTNNTDKSFLVSVSHRLPSKDFIEFSLYVWPSTVSNQMN